MKTVHMPVLHRRGGYEIRGDSRMIVFIVRDTYGAGIGAAVSGGIAVILLVNAALQGLLLQSIVGLYIAIPGAALLALSALFLKTYLHRKRADPDTVPARYRIDLEARTLSDSAGTVLAGTGDIAFTCGYNFLNRTYGMSVVLPSKRKIRVYAERVTGFSSAHVMAVCEEVKRAVSGNGDAAAHG
jgi:hypothetical protein